MLISTKHYSASLIGPCMPSTSPGVSQSEGRSQRGSLRLVVMRHFASCLMPKLIRSSPRHQAMKYLLDTDAFSDIVRGNTDVEARCSRIPLSLVRISSVTVK